jgi:putative DNA primase/helicase
MIVLRESVPGLETISLAMVKAKPIDWLWRGRFALGTVSIVAGDGGLGKSTILCDIASRITTGDRWPDGEVNSNSGSVVMLIAEDGLEHTVKPRVVASGGNVEKIYIIRGSVDTDDKGGQQKRWFNLQADIAKLETLCKHLGDVRAIILDPITSYLGETDSHKNDRVRQVLDPLGGLAERLNVAIICNNHHTKGSGGTSANNKVIGSVAFVNQARTVFTVLRDANDEMRRLFIPSKMNIAALGEGIGYRIVQALHTIDDQEILCSSISWDSEPVNLSADQALAALQDGEGGALEREAREFLQDYLRDRTVPAKVVEEEAKGRGISSATLRRARKHLVLAKKSAEKDGPWEWSLLTTPDHNKREGAQGAQESHTTEREHLPEIDDADRPASYWER